MQTTVRSGRLVVGLSLLTLAAALGPPSVGLVLAEVHEPSGEPGRFGVVLSPEEVRGSSAWSEWHRRFSALFLAGTISLSITLAWFVHRTRSSGVRSAVLLVS